VTGEAWVLEKTLGVGAGCLAKEGGIISGVVMVEDRHSCDYERVGGAKQQALLG
jgi:hypothetical protein